MNPYRTSDDELLRALRERVNPVSNRRVSRVMALGRR
jgi:hypothetical protein